MQAPVPLREGTVVLRDGRQLGWAEFGDPHGVPVLWFHGTPGGRRQIPPIAPVVAVEKHIRIIAVERPGIGLSTNDPDRSLLSWAADVEEFADHIGLDTFGVVGLSGGGPHVLAVAHEMPERVFAAAVLGGLAPIVGDEASAGYIAPLNFALRNAHLIRQPAGEVLSWLMGPVRPFAGQIFEALMLVWPKVDRPHFAEPGMKEMFITDIVGSTANGIRSLVHDLSLFGMPWGFSVADIKVPVHIWHADSDVTVPLAQGEHLHALIPGSEMTIVRGEGHFAGFMRPRDVFGWLLAHEHVMA